MLVFKLKELVARKERQEQRRISLEEISRDIDVARITLTRLSGPCYHSTNTDILDKIGNYFNCSDIAEIIEFIPDTKNAQKILSFRDVKLQRHVLIDKIVEYLKRNPPEEGLDTITVYAPTQGNYFDIVAANEKDNTVIVLFRPKLFYEVDREVLADALSTNPKRIIVITMTRIVPTVLKRLSESLIKFYYAEIIYDEINETIMELKLEELE